LGVSPSGYWTLDGQVMDRIDIAGYFSSSPESVREGAFVSIMGVGLYQRNTWKMADLEVSVSRDSSAARPAMPLRPGNEKMSSAAKAWRSARANSNLKAEESR